MKHSNGRFFIGLLLILIGAAFIVKNLDLVPWHIEYYYLSWPTYIVLVGVVITLASRGSFFGIAVILTGGVFLFGRIYDYRAGEVFADFWPVFLILFGLSIIFKHRKGGSQNTAAEGEWMDYEGDSLDITTIFSENKRRLTSNKFVGAKVFTLFGSTVIDMMDAKLERSCSINCDTLFGGTELIVPSDWKVVNKTTAVFAGADDQRRKSAPVKSNDGNVLTIDGFVMFGGIEIKS